MSDKARRKQIRDELRLKAKEEFENSLPMSRERFKGLFTYLDSALQKEKCDDDHTLTIWFLNLIGAENADEIISWLIDNDGFVIVKCWQMLKGNLNTNGRRKTCRY